ncbi:unnamed protein product [Clonostachys rosea]|uniref:DUF676 domain-containing protein n=1 Tax=Bionectria ochroleuca TaxID=29856 RepID=A0ABY6U8W7_BIOOC|nr:unnamed protein product [Clonostachys rosea]
MEPLAFRLRGVPHSSNAEDVVQSIKKAFDAKEFQWKSVSTHSLVESPGRPGEKTATGSFDQWRGPLPVDSHTSILCFCHECSKKISDGQERTHKEDLVLDFRFEGLTILSSPVANNWEFESAQGFDHLRISVIAIPGLGGHTFESFQQRGSTFMWLRDRLPKDIPGARIFTWGYESMECGGDFLLNIEDLGMDFREALRLVSCNGVMGCGTRINRPIILLGHSVGGLVIQEAILSMMIDRQEYDANLKQISAMIFLDVPRQTMRPRRFGTISLVDPVTGLDDVYMEDPDFMQPETKSSSQEDHEMELLVGKDSATFGKEYYHDKRRFHTVGINSTHLDIVKFQGPQDDAYHYKLLPWLKRLQDKGSATFQGIVNLSPFPANDSGRVFRIRGIPSSYLELDLVKELKTVLGLGTNINILVESLALNPDELDEKCATIRFDPIPQQLGKLKSVGGRGDTWSIERPDQGIAAELDGHFYGITPLHIGDSETYSADSIIALSGLNGHAFGSFKARGSPWMWLRDALPQYIKDSRIFIYGYDTKLIGSSSFQSLRNLGQVLYLTIRNLRQTDSKSTGVPLIFIGHSLGGLVIKEVYQMIKIMTEEKDHMNSTILDAIRGILFFGTPHTGMNTGSLAQMARGRPNEELVKSLDIDSQYLKTLDDGFHVALRSLDPKPQLIGFFETRLSASARQDVSEDLEGKEVVTWRMDGDESLAVDEKSATYNMDQRYPIDRDHSHIVKFESRYDLYFKIVRGQIKRLIDQPLYNSVAPAEGSASQRSKPSIPEISKKSREGANEENETEFPAGSEEDKVNDTQAEQEGGQTRKKRLKRQDIARGVLSLVRNKSSTAGP